MDNTLQILQAVNTFYSNSFNQLITLTVAILAFSGILLPILISFYQNKQIKSQKETLELLITEKSEAIKYDIREEITGFYKEESERFNEEIIRLEGELEKIKNKSSGQSLHLQGNLYLSNNFHLAALSSYIRSVSCYAKCKDELNFRRVLKLATDCLPMLDNSIFKSAYDIEEMVSEMFVNVDDINENKRYTDSKKTFNIQYEKLKNRNPKKNLTNSSKL